MHSETTLIWEAGSVAAHQVAGPRLSLCEIFHSDSPPEAVGPRGGAGYMSARCGMKK